MDFEENRINFFSMLALIHGPTVWSSRARFGPRAANWSPLLYGLQCNSVCRWPKGKRIRGGSRGPIRPWPSSSVAMDFVGPPPM